MTLKSIFINLFHPHKKYDDEAEKIKTRIIKKTSQTEAKIVVLNRMLQEKSVTYHLARAMGVIK